MDSKESKRVVCGAKTRSGGTCKRSPTRGKKRCKFHGGAAGHGAPKGNKNAFKHGLYTDALLPEEMEIWDHVKDQVGKLDDEITLMRIRLMRLNRIQKEADSATISGKNESKALQLEEVSSTDTSSSGVNGAQASKTSMVVKKRRDYHAEIRQVTKLIGELEERRAKLLSGESGNDSVDKFRAALQGIDDSNGYSGNADDTATIAPPDDDSTDGGDSEA